VPLEEPAVLRDVLVSLRRDPSAASTFGATVRRDAETYLSTEASLERHERFVLAVASRSAGGRREESATLSGRPANW
jgi:hypothetical protein